MASILPIENIEKEFEPHILSIIDSIPNGYKLYFNKILIQLAERHFVNIGIIYDYIIAEETKKNINNSTKEDRIKVLTLLFNFYDNTKSFKQMTK